MHPDRERAEAACVEDTRAGEHLGIARARILRQIAEFTGPVDATGGREKVSGEHLGQRGLAGAVATHQTDLVAVADAERDVRHEHAGAHADLEIVHGEHSEGPFRRGGGSAEGPASQYTATSRGLSRGP